MRIFVLIAGFGLIILTAMALLKYEPWKRGHNDERIEYSAPTYGSEDPGAALPPATVAAAPPIAPPKAAPAPPAPVDDRVAEDAAAVGMTTIEPDEAPSGSGPAPSSDEPIV